VSRCNHFSALLIEAEPDDIENQQAVRLAKEADPFGERTIGRCEICLTESNIKHTLGVLTKPDTLPPGASGSRKRWMTIIEGHQHQLKHGYYCVRLPDDDERARNISRMESSKIATDFFNGTPPWNTVASRNRFGVHNLVSDLSWILVGLIEKK
jgi:vacuolar protein sorting-associated protein 1